MPGPTTALRRTPASLATLLALSLLSGAARGQSAQSPAASGQPASLAPVTVSASALDTPSNEMAAPVTVLRAEELVLRRAATLGDQLAGGSSVASARPDSTCSMKDAPFSGRMKCRYA